MLVLTRKLDEALIIDGKIEVVILGVEEGKVRIGISAPPEVKVHRKEILEAVSQENKAALEAARKFLKK
ncbi:carbon storage regulator CsrA [Acidaminobacter sp.]|uniref:carbon storage regulator CsrA n=1 Tax=Acidaminobacter sp. TaxID=1872102 RepID=UPI00137EC00C|nr:carbon storage regulator CsrA [Acidaminobacter sp.]MDK9710596.1 carbon storage regulator CsrA [Acidaminobacter sp.]MZQ96793.1 carbon storage regulator CsrA [Acidaminobacter sp.]